MIRTAVSYLFIFIIAPLLIAKASQPMQGSISDIKVIDSLLDKAEEYLYTNNDSASFYINEAKIQIEGKHLTSQLLRLNELHAYILREHGMLDSAIAVRLKNIVFIKKEEVDSSNKLDLLSAKATSLGDIAAFYRLKGSYETSLSYNHRAFDVFDSLRVLDPENDEVLKKYGRSINAIGVNHAAFGNDSTARIYFKKALIFYQRNDFPSNATYTLFNIGANYLDNEQYDSAIHYLEYAKEFIYRLDIDRLKPHILQNLSYAYVYSDFHTKAKPLLEEYIKVGIERKSDHILARAYSQMSNFHRMQGATNDAIEYAKKGLELDTDEINTRISLLNNLSKAYEATRMYRKALKYWKQADHIEDSIYNSESKKALAEIEAKYQTTKNEKALNEKVSEIKMLEKDNHIKSLWTLSLSIGIFLVIISSFIGYRYYNLKAKRKREILEFSLQVEKNKLEHQNQRLTSYTLNFAQKNELFNELREGISALCDNQNGQLETKIRQLLQIIDKNHQVDKEWEVFKTHFEGVHKDFFIDLKRVHCDLTPNDLKICAFTIMNLNLKESSSILGVSPNSVKIARHRIKKKMNIAQEVSLFDYLMKIVNNTI